MALNRKLRKDLLETLGVSRQRLSQKAKAIKVAHGPMSTDDAVYVLAHQEGFDLSKYLEQEIVDRVRNLIPSSNTKQNTQKKLKRAQKTNTLITIDASLPKIDAFISTTISQDANKMAKIYPIYYILENSIRIVIIKILEKKYGTNWWDLQAPKTAKDNAANRKASEAKKPWHGKRGQHEIFYSDFGDLRSILEKNWDDFKDLFPSRSWITQKLEELEHPRNILAHHNPIAKRDLQRIELYFNDWIDLLNSKKDLIT